MSAQPDTVLRLALAACPYPGGVADRTPRPNSNTRPELEFVFSTRPGPADAVRRRLLEWSRACSVPALQVWTGDSIYIDATAGLFDPALASTGGGPGARAQARALPEALVRAYAAAHGNLFAAPATRLRAIDDHEIVDNWEPSLDAQRRKADYQRMNAGRRAFITALRNGRLGAPAAADAPVPLWQQRIEQGLRLFVCDTRTERRARDPAAPGAATIMSATQFAALLDWLRPTDDERGSEQGDGQDDGLRRRVIVSPALLLPRRLTTTEQPAAAWRSDAWDGYPASLHALLGALAEQPGLRVLCLSGDEHMPCALRATLQRADQSKPAVELLSVHTGAVYAPYPFANSRPQDFSDEPDFGFEAGGTRYVCRLDPVRFIDAPGDGFVGIDFDARLEPLRIAWHRADGGTQPLWP